MNPDALDWASLEGARGPATAVPENMRLLSSAKAADRRRAIDTLTDILVHDGQITPAAVAAAPFLVQAAVDPTNKIADRLLVLLADLATGGSHVRYLARGFDVKPESVAQAPEDHPLQRIHRAVAAGRDGYVAALSRKEAAVRSAASLTLAMLPREAPVTIQPVRAKAAADTDAAARASAVLSLGMLGRYLEKGDDRATFERLLGEGEPLLRFAAAVALAYVARSEWPASARDELVGWAGKGPAAQQKNFPWGEGTLDQFAVVVLMEVAARSGDIPLLRQLLELSAGKPTEARVASAAVDVILFEDPPIFAEPRLPADLGDAQRSLLGTILEREGLAWKIRGTLVRHGLLGSDWDVARSLGLGVRAGGPMDRVVEGEPLWRTALAVVHGRAPKERWLQRVTYEATPEQVLAACEDAAVPPYALNVPWPPPGQSPWGVEQENRARLQTLLVETIERRVPADALAAAADRLLASGRTPDLQAAVLTIAMSDLLDRQKTVPEARFDKLVGAAMVGEAFWRDLRRVLERLPVERREALVLGMRFNHYFSPQDGPGGTLHARGAWRYADLAPTRAVAEAVITAILAWRANDKVPEDRAVDVLTRIGEVARPLVSAALADPAVTQREVLRRALEGIGAKS
ncbi:MAG: hypothetical protein ABSE49_03565 [Polyangiaceae bacterium]